ncbi:MAG: MauE/DoxX family redox-associated membrane protein [Ignavibacteriaceae bacterium]
MPVTGTIITRKYDLPDGALKKGGALYYIHITLTWFITAALLFAGVSKIVAPEGLMENLSTTFSFLSLEVIIAVSTLLPVIEIIVGILLISSLYNEKARSKRKLIGILSTSLFALFLLYSIYGLIFGIGADCGCFGNVVNTNFGWGMIVRNLIFLAIAVISLKIGFENLVKSEKNRIKRK